MCARYAIGGDGEVADDEGVAITRVVEQASLLRLTTDTRCRGRRGAV